MDQSLVIISSLILLVVGILGTFLPVLPGLLVAFAGLVLYKYGTVNEMPTLYVWIFGFLTLLSIFLSYFIPSKINRKFGGTLWGSIGAFLGSIVGLFWIPIPFGFLLGMLLGVLIGELLHDAKDTKKAWNSMKGALLGFLYGTSFSFIVGVSMFLVVLYYVIF